MSPGEIPHWNRHHENPRYLSYVSADLKYEATLAPRFVFANSCGGNNGSSFKDSIQ